MHLAFEMGSEWVSVVLKPSITAVLHVFFLSLSLQFRNWNEFSVCDRNRLGWFLSKLYGTAVHGAFYIPMSEKCDAKCREVSTLWTFNQIEKYHCHMTLNLWGKLFIFFFFIVYFTTVSRVENEKKINYTLAHTEDETTTQPHRLKIREREKSDFHRSFAIWIEAPVKWNEVTKYHLCFVVKLHW